MHTAVALAAALLGAATFAVSAVLQQRAAATAPPSESLKFRLLLRLAHRRDFLLGTLGLVCAYTFQAVGLAFGTVALVAPIVATELVFAIPLAIRVYGKRPTKREWLAALSVTGGVAAFLIASAPKGSIQSTTSGIWAGSIGGASLAIGGLILLAKGPPSRRRATLLAMAGGISNGLVTLLTKAFFNSFKNGVGNAFADWKPYLLLSFGVLGFLLAQSAFQAAPLADSLPVLDTLEPVTGVIMGVLVLGETVAVGAIRVVVELLGGAWVILGIFHLGKSPVVLSIYETQREEQKEAERIESGDSIGRG